MNRAQNPDGFHNKYKPNITVTIWATVCNPSPPSLTNHSRIWARQLDVFLSFSCTKSPFLFLNSFRGQKVWVTQKSCWEPELRLAGTTFQEPAHGSVLGAHLWNSDYCRPESCSVYLPLDRVSFLAPRYVLPQLYTATQDLFNLKSTFPLLKLMSCAVQWVDFSFKSESSAWDPSHSLSEGPQSEAQWT